MDVPLFEPPASPIPDVPLDAVLVFPLLAVALLVLFPIFGKVSTKTTSRSEKDRLRRRRLLGRVSVIVLPLAAAVSVALPLRPLDPFGTSLQALLIFAIVLAPLFLWHAALTWRQTRAPAGRSADAGKRAGRGAGRRAGGAGADGEAAAPAIGGGRASGIRASRIQASGVRVPAEGAPSARSHTSSDAYATPPGDGSSRGRRTHGDPTDAVVEAEERRIDEQLDRLVSLVDSYDLREDEHRRAGSDRPLPETKAVKTEVADRRAAAGDGAPGGSGSTARTGLDPEALRATAQELRDMKGIKVVRLVNGLRVDRRRLQRLVIAQRAAHESERQAHRRTRIVARDAVHLAHASRASRRLAEKALRRERRERTLAEEKYARVTNALHGIMSIVEAERGERTGDGDEAEELRRERSEAPPERALRTS